MEDWVVYLIIGISVCISAGLLTTIFCITKARKRKKFERGLKMVPLLIHLPPSTDDIQTGGRDERDIANEAVSQAQVMYSILSSTLKKGTKSKVYGQRHFSFEIISRDGLIKYYAVVPAVLSETVKQAIQSAYPTARVEEKFQDNLFAENVRTENVSGAELTLKKEFYFPIATYEDTKRDASMAILNALSNVNKDEGAAVQILFRPANTNWLSAGKKFIEDTQKGKNKGGSGYSLMGILKAPLEVPEDQKEKAAQEPISNVDQDKITAVVNKMRYPAFETLVRVITSAPTKARSEAILSGVLSSFSQFDTTTMNGFKVNIFKRPESLVINYVFKFFPLKCRTSILNSVELASLYHLPEQNAIPNSRVERQLTKQVDGPAQLADSGILLGVNQFRGAEKKIYLDDDNRRRHLYMIGQTGSGKSVFLENIAFQDMCDGRGFAFIDPHGDAVEALLQRVPEDRIDDVIYFDPSDIEHPVGMNMFEFTNPDQKDFIVQEGINMLQSLFDPTNQGFFGPRGQHMFRNAALLLMSDPEGATFIDIPQCFTDPEFVKSKLKYVTDRAVYDYWTKEFPASQKSNDAGEVITWFTSKWGPFLANTTMRNILGQTKSGFNIREIMDNKKIFLVNLSKGKLGDLNSQLLGMIFVMKFQQAAMSRADIPEHERKDFCLFVDEFQNFATDSFESILSEARKYRLNLIVANQFMTQLTDKIREAILGNVGTILCGRLGVTDAELIVKAFSPTFTLEDMTKLANYSVICKVMMFGMPSAPFTMKFLPPMGDPNVDLMNSLKDYTAVKYGRTRAEVEKEINERWNKANKEKQGREAAEAASRETVEPNIDVNADVSFGSDNDKQSQSNDFMDKWLKRKSGGQ